MSSPVSVQQLVALLTKLEVPECACEVVWRKVCRCEGDCDHPEVIVSPPCEHVLAADHVLSLERWADMLASLIEEYAVLPLPEPACVITRQARIALYTERARAKLALFHPRDSWRRLPLSGADMKVAAVSERNGTVARLRNGRVNPNETLSSTRSRRT